MRRRPNNPVSLFPFLAVLVCAMGALIFLLLITTRRIRAAAVNQATPQARPIPAPEPAPEPEPIGPSLEDQLAVARVRVDQLEVDREERLQHGERLAAEIDAATQLVEVTAADADAAGLLAEQADRERQNFEQQYQRLEAARVQQVDAVVELEQRLDRERQRRARGSSRYVLLPFDGRNGTTRRPIFIECTSGHLRFVPENVELSAGNLAGSTASRNPLLAGARALGNYWSVHDRKSSSDEPVDPAYVLLVVRPGGSRAFYAARKLLAELGHPFGYELVDEELEIEWPEMDEPAAAVCRVAVEAAVREMSAARREKGWVDAGTRGRGDAARGGNAGTPGRGVAVKSDAGTQGRGDAGTRGGEGAGKGDAGNDESKGVSPARPMPGREPAGGGFGAIAERFGARGDRRHSSGGNRGSSHRRWGLYELGAQIGYERRVTLEVAADTVRVGDRELIAVGDRMSADQLAGRVVEQIEQEVRGWGRPPERFYWVPTVRLKVRPGGLLHSESLAGRLARWGLRSTEEFTLDSPVPDTLSERFP